MKTNTLLRILPLLVSATVLIAGAASINAQTTLEGPGSGLVGWWKFEEGSGTIAHDSAGNGNHGILIGSPRWTSAPMGGALAFNGVTDYIRIPFSDSLMLGVKTIAVWASLDDFLKQNCGVYGWGRGPEAVDNYYGFIKPDGRFIT